MSTIDSRTKEEIENSQKQCKPIEEVKKNEEISN